RQREHVAFRKNPRDASVFVNDGNRSHPPIKHGPDRLLHGRFQRNRGRFPIAHFQNVHSLTSSAPRRSSNFDFSNDSTATVVSRWSMVVGNFENSDTAASAGHVRTPND